MIEKLREAGAEIEAGPGGPGSSEPWIRVRASGVVKYRGLRLVATPFD